MSDPAANIATGDARQHWTARPGGDLVRDVERALGASGPQVAPSRSYSQPLLRESPHEGVADPGEIAKPGGFRRHHVASVGNMQRLPRAFTPALLRGPEVFQRFGGGLPIDTSDDEQEEGDTVVRPDAALHSDEHIEGVHYGTRSAAPFSRISQARGVRPTPSKQVGYVSLKEQDTDDTHPHTVSATDGAHKYASDSVPKLVLAILKAFVGSAVLFVPKAFENGGMLFSPVVLTAVAAVSVHCMLLLIRVRERHALSYGELGMLAYGRLGHTAVNIALVMSQVRARRSQWPWRFTTPSVLPRWDSAVLTWCLLQATRQGC